jgi:hypothetical protein
MQNEAIVGFAYLLVVSLKHGLECRSTVFHDLQVDLFCFGGGLLGLVDAHFFACPLADGHEAA